MNFYNENDPKAAAWLCALIKKGLIPDGRVREVSIEDILPGEFDGYHQHHFFAGIGGWPYALELAGWPEDRPVWTGSCPCQPFSVAGKRKGTSDERHLWPVWRELIAGLRPPVIFGEQVASPLGREWLSGVRSDLEALGYEVGAADLCAASAGAPHIRQRLFWVAHSKRQRSQGRVFGRSDSGREDIDRHAGCGGATSGMADADHERFRKARNPESGGGPSRDSSSDGLENGGGKRWRGGSVGCNESEAGRLESGTKTQGSSALSPWADFDIVHCRDNKARRIEPGTFPLVTRLPIHVAQLRGLGNAIVPQIAAIFIRAYIEAERWKVTA